jgi:hypothetical protein
MFLHHNFRRPSEVPIVAGTDKAVPAHSLHRELELDVAAGLTPMQVIRIAALWRLAGFRPN